MKMPLIFKNEKGVALILVLSAIVMLTMLGVDFAYNAHIEYTMAKHQLERLQSQYLANSAHNLVRLELKLNQQIKQALSRSNVASKIQVDLSTPLCEQFPMSSALLRLAVSGSLSAPEVDGSEVEEGQGSEGAPAPMLAGISLVGGEDFLDFEGDFEGACSDEGAKIDLNYFSELKPETSQENQVSEYDSYKTFIMMLFQKEEYRNLFEKLNLSPTDVIRNIADWVDENREINELGGVSSGSEDSIYEEGSPKNGKFTTRGDIFKVAGVSDLWWPLVNDLFTIYGTGKINICRAPDELVKGLILRYTAGRTDIPPIRQEDEELMEALEVALLSGCQGISPDTKQMEQELDSKLIELLGAEEQKAKGSPSLADWVTGESQFYKLDLSGQVNNTVVRIQSVIDVGEGGGVDTRKWKTVYWRID